jgi:tyrosyl-tRNA synthetase
MSEFTFLTSINIVEIMKKTGFIQSNSEGKRLINQGGVYVNNERINSIDFLLNSGDYLLKVGKRKFAKIVICNKNKS